MQARQFTFDEAIAYLEGHIDHAGWAARSGRTVELDMSLDRMQRLMSLLGEPQRQLEVVHLTGTNGKGSTSRMITRLLMTEGLRVGTYSSPHLARYNERFRIDDVDIDDPSLAGLLGAVADAEDELGERLMPFEALTAAAFRWFAAESVDVAVVEVGVLGRFDATNVADARVAVITNIGFDHTNGLGDWSSRIAAEKAGIIKVGSHLVLGDVERRHRPTFDAEGPAAVWALGDEIVLDVNESAAAGRVVSVTLPGQRIERARVPLLGEHQGVNAALALAAAAAFLRRPLRHECVDAGLRTVVMPARLELIRTVPTVATVVLDGAHNPDAIAALAAALAEHVPAPGRRSLVIGLLAGRDPAAMLRAIRADGFDEVVACTPPTGRALAAEVVAEVASSFGCSVRVDDDVAGAVASLIADSGPDDLIVVTGSIYLVAEARSALIEMGDEIGRTA